ncbi:hypothetical protein BZL29_1501 [Mycobacterium kansasii]|uniref:Uncharacterized protein n=1 Tax=Mycobacterium kansasii TaxID=1768 RepID=A0A1V3XX43_MYCKA|nr:hypothetical protein BZL29_1501 [Mycobacterium kansasii]
MAVKSAQRGRRRALLQRWLDMIAEIFDLAARKISAATDPRPDCFAAAAVRCAGR